MHTPKLITWVSIEKNHHSVENAKLKFTENGNSFESYINGFSQEPFVLYYRLKTDINWQLESVEIDDLLNGRTLQLTRTNEAWWDGNSKIQELSHCSDIDISLTPATNALPINRLSYTIDEPKQIKVIYFDYFNWKYQSVRQRYTMIKENKFFYENLDSCYKTELLVDSNGFIISYPGLFQRLDNPIQ